MVFGLAVLFAFPQRHSTPPESVRQSFTKEYPKSAPTHWNRSGTVWSATFEDRDNDNGEATAHFDAQGRYMDTHVLYDNHDVPAPVTENINKQYPGSDHQKYTRIDRPRNGDLYQVNLKHQGKSKTLYVDDKGQETHYAGNR